MSTNPTNPKSKILDKIRKLLNLADGAGATEAEAALALDRAQSLIYEHQISETELSASMEPDEAISLDLLSFTGRSRSVWENSLLTCIGKVHNVYVIADMNLSAYQMHGTPSNVAIVTYFYDYLKSVISGLADSGFVAYQQAGGLEHGRKWKTRFKMAAVVRIYERLKDKRERTLAILPESKRALILRDSTKLEAYKAQYRSGLAGTGVRIQDSRPTYRGRSDGSAAGRNAADGIGLRDGLAGGGEAQRQLTA